MCCLLVIRSMRGKLRATRAGARAARRPPAEASRRGAGGRKDAADAAAVAAERRRGAGRRGGGRGARAAARGAGQDTAAGPAGAWPRSPRCVSLAVRLVCLLDKLMTRGCNTRGQAARRPAQAQACGCIAVVEWLSGPPRTSCCNSPPLLLRQYKHADIPPQHHPPFCCGNTSMLHSDCRAS